MFHLSLFQKVFQTVHLFKNILHIKCVNPLRKTNSTDQSEIRTNRFFLQLRFKSISWTFL